MKNYRTILILFLLTTFFVITYYSKLFSKFKINSATQSAYNATSEDSKNINYIKNRTEFVRNISNKDKKIQKFIITPDIARKKIQEALQIEDIGSRAKECSEIIMQLCLAGYTSEAWELIDKDFGRVRTFELDAFFRTPNMDVALFKEKFKSLYNSEESRSAMNSWFSNFDPNQITGSLLNSESNQQFLLMKDLDSACFSNAVYNRLHDGLETLSISDGDNRLNSADTLQKKGLLRPIEIIRMFSDLGNLGNFEKWDRFKKYTADVNYGSDQGFVDHVSNDMIKSMIRESATKTVLTILNEDGDMGAKYLQFAVQEWSELDSRGAFDWYQKNSKILSAEKKSYVAAGFFGKAFDNNELDVARQWANEINIQKMRDGALAGIDKKEAELKSK